MRKFTEVEIGIIYLSTVGEVVLKRIEQLDGTKEWYISVEINGTVHFQHNKNLLEAINLLINKMEWLKDASIN